MKTYGFFDIRSTNHYATILSETPLGSISGHTPYRVSKAEFHPSGRFIATCWFACFLTPLFIVDNALNQVYIFFHSHDNSWRLWDVEQQVEVLYQEGHSRPVLDIAFQCDGSICATGYA